MIQDFRRLSLNEADIVPSIPGKIRKADGSYTDVLAELGVTKTAVTPPDSANASVVRVDGAEYNVSAVLAHIKSKTDIADALNVMTTRGDIIYRNATVPARLAKGTSGQVLTQGANDPAWATPSAAAANVSIADSGNLYAAENTEDALAEIGALPVTAIPSSGTIADGTKYRNSGPDLNEATGWVCTTAGTQGTLNSGSTTGSITNAKTALTVNALTGLLAGQYINIVGVTGPLQVSSLPAALGSTTVLATSAASQKYLTVSDVTNFAVGETIEIGRGEASEEIAVIASIGNASTTVDVESAADQKVLSVAATTGFTVGDPILIDSAGVAEWKIIESIQEGVSLTTTVNLANTHAIGVTVVAKYLKTADNLTQEQAATRTVTNCVILGSASDATVNGAAVSFSNAVISPFGYVNTDWKAWTPVLTWGTADPADVATVARYNIIDKTVNFNVYISSADGNDASSLTVSLPVAPKDNNSFITPHALQLIDASWREAMAYIDDGASVIGFYNFGACTDAAACKFIISGQYEIA